MMHITPLASAGSADASRGEPSRFRWTTIGVGEPGGRPYVAGALIIAGLVALLIGMLTPGGERESVALDWLWCPSETHCRSVDVSALELIGPAGTLKTVYVGADRIPHLPLAVHITAMASAEVRWNGVLIGRNGLVGDSRAEETPGRFDAVFHVPTALVHPGTNIVTVHLSAHHLWLPVARPIHRLSVGPLDARSSGVFLHYLPTLIVIGLLIVAFATNLFLYLLRRSAIAAVFALLAGAIVLQAAVETSKLTLTYPYPWQLARLVALTGLAAFAGLVVTIAALSWVREARMRAAILLMVIAGFASAWLLLPWWDAKALWAFRIGVLGALVASAIGTVRAAPHAHLAGIAGIAALALSGIPGFLDLGYYLTFVGLFACQIPLAVRAMRPAPRVATVPPAVGDGTELIIIPNGGSQQRVAVRDVLYVRADDDYSVVHLVDGRQLLATMNLAALLRLPRARLLRIHRSHAINPDKVEAVHRAGRLARTVELVGGTCLPVGRTYWDATANMLTSHGADGRNALAPASAETSTQIR
ncbi:LytTR family DNA-binding domain-containing protein [Sphingosinicella sp. LHD-64]|uniref:LytTR family DNA-binding domain-containing protein n=1 Tax=Sphingosinicella sp. LHD-64 TaxID=3072139 RepID=UPI00280FE88D|nr:LytTR family DNA-binding domain-containing protein [Sphingosinicella sp. LHD-64]MDQ8756227.1 LytTR family DNA-binding domain-containing protein [Sphingosinicella sp. LHD-64]